MKRVFVLSVLTVSFLCALWARIVVYTPESFTITTKQGLVLQFTNQLEGLPNNDAISYFVLSGRNKSPNPVRLAPESFKLKDEAGSEIVGISARDALKAVVDWNFQRADGYIRIADSDLRDVLRSENRRYTTEKELTEVSLKPQQEVKEKLIFFPKLTNGKYTLELAADKVDIVVSDTVYFVRPEKAGKK